jgi:hypothetical protein
MANYPQEGKTPGPRATPSARDVRLKAALQANIARRKAQGRAFLAEVLRGVKDTGPDAARGPTEPGDARPHSPQDHPGASAPPDPSQKD